MAHDSSYVTMRPHPDYSQNARLFRTNALYCWQLCILPSFLAQFSSGCVLSAILTDLRNTLPAHLQGTYWLRSAC
eukprot:6213761-Pleurochrysis_carterae.AAC.4